MYETQRSYKFATMSKIRNLLVVSDKLKNTIQSSYGKSDEEIKKEMDILYDWWKKQQHLPFVKDDEILERTLMKNKFRIEQTKRKLDGYFTLKGMYPEFFSSSWEEVEKSLEICFKAIYFFPLPKATEVGERLWILKVKNQDQHEAFNFVHFFRYTMVLLELIGKWDYCDSLRCLHDLEGYGLQFFKKMEPMIMYKGMKLTQDGFSFRFSGIDYCNAPSYIDLLVGLMNPLVRDGKIKVHKRLEDINESYPKELMPAEYGGSVGSLQKLQDTWKEEIYRQKDFIKERMQYKSDETKRIGKSPYNDLFGSDGTFKAINVD